VHVGGENAPPWCGISGPLELAETGSICGGRLSNLSVWRLRRGIYLERITPGYPEAHGGTSACTRSRRGQRPSAARPLRHVVRCYNCERPHQASTCTRPRVGAGRDHREPGVCRIEVGVKPMDGAKVLPMMA
jgi:hypothetical protein